MIRPANSLKLKTLNTVLNSRLPLAWRFIGATIFIVIIVEAIWLSYSFHNLKSSMTKALHADSERTVNLMAKLAETPLGEGDLPSLEKIVIDFTRDPQVSYILIFDSNGQQVTTSSQVPENLESVYVVSQKVLSSARNGEAVGIIEMGFSTKDLKASTNNAIVAALLGGLTLIAALILVMSVTFRIFINRPLEKMVRAANNRSALPASSLLQRQDEFGVLARSFNAMVGEILGYTETLEDKVSIRTAELSIANEELTKTNREIELSRNFLIHSAKMNALGAMAAGIAHEINNPLASLSGTLQILSREEKKREVKDEKLIAGIDKALGIVKRIAKIVAGMKTFSRKGDADPFTPNDLRNLIEESVELCRDRFRQHEVELFVEVSADSKVACRPTEITQVIVNLLNNACDAVAGKESSWAKLELEVTDTLAKIYVTDSGLGIPQEIVDRLMEPFFTTKEPGKGTGLGLSISIGIAEAHNGSLTIDREHKNTRFILTLPTIAEETKIAA